MQPTYNKYCISIDGIDNPDSFIKVWSDKYYFSELEEQKYHDYIKVAFASKENFIKLFEWKNGTKEKIAGRKIEVINSFWEILINITNKSNIELEEFEKVFNPKKNATIWKIFVLHLFNPDKFPIFDQHVYRAYLFLSTGQIKDLPASYSEVFDIYKTEYIDWFMSLKKQSTYNYKKIDEALITFGQMLKAINKFPHTVKKQQHECV